MAAIGEERKIAFMDDKVIIKNFFTYEPDIVSYFAGLPEYDNMERRLEDILRVGVAAARSTRVMDGTGHVERTLDGLDARLRYRLEEAFGEGGRFSDLLEKHLGKDGETIRDLLDPDRKGSPLYLLRRDIENDLHQIGDGLGLEGTGRREPETDTQKRFHFEGYCEEKLEQIARIHSDKLENTVAAAGSISGSKKGAFVITLGDTGERMVFEVKDRGSMTLPEIQRSLDEAMLNREAIYGILIAKNKGSLNKSIGWFNEYDGKHLVCALGDDGGESLADGGMIHIAYKWARTRMEIASGRKRRPDASVVTEKSCIIQSKLKSLGRIKSQCTSIEMSAEEIRRTARETESAIKGSLEDIIESMSGADACCCCGCNCNMEK